MKRFGLMTATILLFVLSIYVAFLQGVPLQSESLDALKGSALKLAESPVIYTGIRAEVATFFASLLNAFLVTTGGNMLVAIMLLALLVELVLLYPSVRIQIKQKIIHLFHKKLVDRFESGEISFSKTQDELHKLYAVNEKIHSRGAVMVLIQLLVFMGVFWGLALLVRAPQLLETSWSIGQLQLLNKPATFLLPLLASLLYFLHSLIKIVLKEKQDYISPAQTITAIIFAVIGATVVYYFATLFAVTLTVYFITQIAFATLRFVWVERHAKTMERVARQKLMAMLRAAKPAKDRFEAISRKWNHLPVVRHLNFHLLEEALSMSLGLLLALNFFGLLVSSPIQADRMSMIPNVYAQSANPDYVTAAKNDSNTCGEQVTNTTPYPVSWDATASNPFEMYWEFLGTNADITFVEFFVHRRGANQLPPETCVLTLPDDDDFNYVISRAGTQQSCTVTSSTDPANLPFLCGSTTCDETVILNSCSYRLVRSAGESNELKPLSPTTVYISF